MNEKLKEEKIKRFLADEVMAFIVKDVLREAFLKASKSQDTMYLAASRIAIDLLDEGFRELQKYKSANRDSAAATSNAGL